VGHQGDEFLEGLGFGLLLGWGSRRRRTVSQPPTESGCSNACGCVVVAALLFVVGSLALHLWYVALPAAVAAVAWAMVRHSRRRTAAAPRRGPR
jgi:peptidoglycan/LPS O-acetylase OafA/YrhL